jgi:hypothetical protein
VDAIIGENTSRGFSRSAIVAMCGSYVVGVAMQLSGAAPAIRCARVALIIAAFLLIGRLAMTSTGDPATHLRVHSTSANC